MFTVLFRELFDNVITYYRKFCAVEENKLNGSWSNFDYVLLTEATINDVVICTQACSSLQT